MRPEVDPRNESLFAAQPEESPAALAAALAPPAAAGHYDELRGGVCQPLPGAADGAIRAAPDALPTEPWSRFFEQLGHAGFADLNRRRAQLQRQVRDNGITYNVYAEPGAPQRPWAVDLFPLLLDATSWRQIEAGVLQRVRLLERMLDDLYGPQQLLRRNLLPPALVHGHPGFLRAMHGVAPVGGRRLHLAAFDLARDPGGAWWIVAQRTQAPSGLGYLLENRLLVARQFPEAFRNLGVQRLVASYQALLDGLRARCPAGGAEPRIVLLTPGPCNETYFEHAYLARNLGITLVEGSDLTVRDRCLYLKTLSGLEPVHGVLKRVDDGFLDPLELRAESQLGVPGLLQAIRAGNVLVANAPGAGLLESPGLLGFLPALGRELLGEELLLPSVASWWCGERAALEDALPRLAQAVIRPSQGDPMDAVVGAELTPAQLAQWALRLQDEPDRYTVQAWPPPSQMPTWQSGPDGDRIAPRSLLLRVFAIADGDGWRVLPGGLTRLAGSGLALASMQRGGSSADTWVLGDGADHTGQFPAPGHAVLRATTPRSRTVTSRSAENLFWLGRYTERSENTARLARLALATLNGEDQSSRPLLAWLSELAAGNGLVLPAVPPATQSRRVFERSLLAALGDAQQVGSVAFNLAAMRCAAAAVRDRLSQEQWNMVQACERNFLQGRADSGAELSPVEALRLLEALSGRLAAITGLQADRMTRDAGWRLLSIGRQLERLAFLAQALQAALACGTVDDPGGYEAVVALFDSTITYRAEYQLRHDLPALLDLLVLDQSNPRGLGGVAHTLRNRLERLAGERPPLAPGIPDPDGWQLEALYQRAADGRLAALEALLQQCVDAAHQLSDQLTARYFAHSDDARQSLLA